MTLSIPVTSFYVTLLAPLMFVLTWLVSMRRAMMGKAAGDIAKFVFGHGDDETLQRRIRAFGNFNEYTPTALLFIALIEMQGAPTQWLWWLGGIFCAGRYLHAIGMLYCPRIPLPRIIGMFATYAALLVPAVWLVLHIAVAW